MTFSVLGAPALLPTLSKRRLFKFFLFGAGGAGAGNGGEAGGHGACVAFSSYLEEGDILYLYKGLAGTTGGTSNASIGGGGGGASGVWITPRRERLSSDPNGYGVNGHLLLASAGGGGGGGTDTSANGGNGGLIDATTGDTLTAGNGGGTGTSGGSGATATGPGSGGVYDIFGDGQFLFQGSAGNSGSWGANVDAGNGGNGYTDNAFSVNFGGLISGPNRINIFGSSDDSQAVGGRGYQGGGAGGGGGRFGGGGSSYDNAGTYSGGGGGGSSFVSHYARGKDFYSAVLNASFNTSSINGYDIGSIDSNVNTFLTGISSGTGGAGAGASTAGSNGLDGYVYVMDENDNTFVQTTGAESGWTATVI